MSPTSLVTCLIVITLVNSMVTLSEQPKQLYRPVLSESEINGIFTYVISIEAL